MPTRRENSFNNLGNQVERIERALSKRYNLRVLGFGTLPDKNNDSLFRYTFKINSNDINEEMHTFLKNRGFSIDSNNGFTTYSITLEQNSKIYTILKGLL